MEEWEKDCWVRAYAAAAAAFFAFLLIFYQIYPRSYLFAIALMRIHFFFPFRLSVGSHVCSANLLVTRPPSFNCSQLDSTQAHCNRIDWASAKQIYSLSLSFSFNSEFIHILYFIFDNVAYYLRQIYSYFLLFCFCCVFFLLFWIFLRFGRDFACFPTPPNATFSLV